MSPSTSLLDVNGPFGAFATTLLADELPALPPTARDATAAFVCRRTQQIPGPLRVGVTALVLAAAASARVVGWPQTTSALQRTQLPLIAELARLVRSLGFAYVWETWPNTGADGAPEATAMAGGTASTTTLAQVPS